MPDNKKLAIFLPALYEGGAERVLLHLAEGIADNGYKVDLVLGRCFGPYMSEIPEKIHLVSFEVKRDLYTLLPLIRYLRRERPDVILSALHTNIISLWAKKIARSSVRLVVSVHNSLSDSTRYYASDLRMRFMPRLIRAFYPWADEIIAVSNGVARDLAQTTGISEEQIRVIYNPAITPKILSKAQEPLEHPWFSPSEPPVILGMGRLTPQKDFPMLIKAFSLVRKQRRARLIILGEGEERPTLEELIDEMTLNDDVSLPGFIDNPYPFLRLASVFVLSSRWEGLPGVLIEALSCGTPLISTDCPSGPREILADGKYGTLIPVGDEKAAAQAILKVLKKKPGPAAEESWHEFTNEFVLDKYIKVLFGNHSSE
jgi:glycosyltransferase involved in cell wall biosynthesis